MEKPSKERDESEYGCLFAIWLVPWLGATVWMCWPLIWYAAQFGFRIPGYLPLGLRLAASGVALLPTLLLFVAPLMAAGHWRAVLGPGRLARKLEAIAMACLATLLFYWEASWLVPRLSHAEARVYPAAALAIGVASFPLFLFLIVVGALGAARGRKG